MKTTTGNQAAGNNTTGIGTGETMAEMKTPAAQPVVVTQIAPAKVLVRRSVGDKSEF